MTSRKLDHSLDGTFAALADPIRRRILKRLQQGEASAGELAKPFDVSQPAVSRHLRVLEDANLIVRRRDGQRLLSRLNPDPLREAWAWVNEYAAYWDSKLDRLDTVLKAQRRGSKRRERG